MIDLQVVGLRVEKYVGESVSGHNCDFTYTPVVKEKYYICVVDEHVNKYEIVLWDEEGQCGSGYTTASWGYMKVNHVDSFKGFTHTPKMPIFIASKDLEESKEISNIVFNYSSYGGDDYYPSGYVGVDMTLFKKNARAKEKRPVWIFKGGSGLGKSYLTGLLEEKTVYETDIAHSLPHVIYEDVVVLGNKYNYTVEDIVSRLFDEVEVILVNFSAHDQIKNESTKMLLTGTVKWFNAEKGFGFIEEKVSGKDFFVKKTEINTVDQSLDAGDIVEFVGHTGMNKYEAKNVYLRL